MASISVAALVLIGTCLYSIGFVSGLILDPDISAFYYMILGLAVVVGCCGGISFMAFLGFTKPSERPHVERAPVTPAPAPESIALYAYPGPCKLHCDEDCTKRGRVSETLVVPRRIVRVMKKEALCKVCCSGLVQ